MVTLGTVHLRYGRVEARIRVPGGRGTWPAFWMLGTDLAEVGWPACGEIDVMEHVGSQPSTVHGTVHVPGRAGLDLPGGPPAGIGTAHDAPAAGTSPSAASWPGNHTDDPVLPARLLVERVRARE